MHRVDSVHPPRVSILMAFYQAERWLAAALDSISGQSFGDWELILVDDASRDGGGAIAAAASFRDPRIRILRNAINVGLAESLNRAMAVARGEYLARMDADDICLSERLKRQVEFLDAHRDVTVLGTAALYVNEFALPLGEVRQPECHSEIVAALPRRNPLIHPTVMMRRDALVAAGGYDARQRYAQDLELWARGASLGWQFHNLQEGLLLFRSQPRTHSNHTWAVFTLRVRNGFRYGYPVRGLAWGCAGVLASVLGRHGASRLKMREGESVGRRISCEAPAARGLRDDG